MTEPKSKRKTLTEVLKTSLPAVLDLSSQTFTWLIEAIMIGHLSTAALAGVGISQQVILLTFTILLTFVVGSSIITARYLGAGDHWNANHILGQSIIVGSVLSIVIALVWYFGAPLIFTVIREEQPIAQMYGIKYISTIAWFAPLIITNFIALGILRSVGDTLITMKVNLFINSLNLILDGLLIFGLFGFPRLETMGAGLAVGISHSIGFFITFYLLRSRKTTLFLAFMEITRPNFDTFRTLIKLGIPTTVEQAIWAVGQLVMSVYAGWLGIVVLATHQIFVRIQMLITMIFFGFGIGSMSIVGKSLGAEHSRQAKRAGTIAALVGFATACVISAILLLVSDQILEMFTNDAAVISVGSAVLLIFALIQLPKGLNIVYSGNLRGSADLNWLMWLAVFTAIGYEMIGSWILAIPFGMGLSGIWLIQGIDELTRFLLNYWRFNKGEWKKLKL